MTIPRRKKECITPLTASLAEDITLDLRNRLHSDGVLQWRRGKIRLVDFGKLNIVSAEVRVLCVGKGFCRETVKPDSELPILTLQFRHLKQLVW
jgi:hypothetical protein